MPKIVGEKQYLAEWLGLYARFKSAGIQVLADQFKNVQSADHQDDILATLAARNPIIVFDPNSVSAALSELFEQDPGLFATTPTRDELFPVLLAWARKYSNVKNDVSKNTYAEVIRMDDPTRRRRAYELMHWDSADV